LGIKRADADANYQERVVEFAVGDLVAPFANSSDNAGRIVALFPAIGMADVEFPGGNKRYPVEDLQRFTDETGADAPHVNSVPGGAGTVRVPGGPFPQVKESSKVTKPAEVPQSGANMGRVAHAFVKKSLYWHAADRKYRATKAETDTKKFACPRCKAKGIEHLLKPAVYKRREGVSNTILGCPGCIFLIKELDIENLSVNAPAEVEIEQPLSEEVL